MTLHLILTAAILVVGGGMECGVLYNQRGDMVTRSRAAAIAPYVVIAVGAVLLGFAWLAVNPGGQAAHYSPGP